MIHYKHAQEAFESYLDSYDRENEKVRLKITHTYGVIDDSRQIAERMHLAKEDCDLAMLIALLHDIGRFEQLKLYDSFLPDTMDHASYGVKLLFEEGMIRQFIEDDRWDSVISTAIAKHSDYRLEEITDARTLLHARLIRDADKLDNCRVKLEEPVETFMDASAEEVGQSEITPRVADTFFQNRSILSSDRVTPMDYWVSYIAYYYDINFRASLDIIEENDFVARTVRRIPYRNPRTAQMMAQMETHMLRYIHTGLIE